MSERIQSAPDPQLNQVHQAQPRLHVVIEPNYSGSSEHPHPVNYFNEPEAPAPVEDDGIKNPVKSTNAAYSISEKTTPDGKPYFIVERPGSHNTVDDTDPQNPSDTDPSNTDPNDTDDQPTVELRRNESRERANELESLLSNFERTRDNYARLSAAHGKRGWLFRSKAKAASMEAIKQSRDEFDLAQFKVWSKEMEIANLDMGLTGEDLQRASAAAAAENQWQLAEAMRTARLPQTPDSLVGKGIAKVVRSFHELWNDKDTKGGKIKKTAAYAAAGFLVGVPVGIVASPILAAVAGGALGVGIAKSVAINRMSLNSGQTKEWIDSKGKKRSKKLSNSEAMYDTYNQHIMDVSDNLDLADRTRPGAYDSYMFMDTDTESHADKNNRDFKIAALAGAIGGLAGGMVGTDFLAAKGAHAVKAANGSGAHHHGVHPKHHKHLHGRKGPTVNPNNINHEYVSQVYEHAEGLHAGFSDMIHAANLAQHHGLIQVVHPQAGNPNLFYYKATKAGAKLAHVKAGSSSTADIVKILSHFGKLKVA